MANSTLEIKILGDCGPFSELGKSIGYLLDYNGSQYMLDTGAPVFQMFGPGGLDEVDGVISTHSHEDHKRWITDLALYLKFSPNERSKLPLICTESLYQKFRFASAFALERSLSMDSRRIVDFSFEDFVDVNLIGPRAKYRCKRKAQDGEIVWRVEDRDGNVLPPDRAKAVTRPGRTFPRLLFRDPEDDIWVEPESYYHYGDERFYEQTDSSDGPKSLEKENFEITPHRAPSWHGVDCSSIMIRSGGEQVLFSSDTRYDPDLWEELAQPRSASPYIETDEFLEAQQIQGDINDYIQQTWSSQRLEKAKSFYDGNVPIIHDVSGEDAVVHTPYKNLHSVENELLLTHSPDRFTSVHPMAALEKRYCVDDGEFKEIDHQGRQFPLNADCYWKQNGSYYVGFEKDEGKYCLVEGVGCEYEVLTYEEARQTDREIITRLQLYEDLNGDYYPMLTDVDKTYSIRKDGRVELRTISEDGSHGETMTGEREQLAGEENVKHPSEAQQIQA